MGLKIVRIINIADKTKSKTLQMTSSTSSQNDINFVGSKKVDYNSNSLGISKDEKISGTFSGGGGSSSTVSWEQIVELPVFETKYSCVNNFFVLGLKLEKIDNSSIKGIVNDTFGGLIVKDVFKNSPNYDLIYPSDLILKVNNRRIEDVVKLNEAINSQNFISITLSRDGKLKSISKLKTIDIIDSILTENNEAIGLFCSADVYKKHSICK